MIYSHFSILYSLPTLAKIAWNYKKSTYFLGATLKRCFRTKKRMENTFMFSINEQSKYIWCKWFSVSQTNSQTNWQDEKFNIIIYPFSSWWTYFKLLHTNDYDLQIFRFNNPCIRSANSNRINSHLSFSFFTQSDVEWC